MSSEFVSGEVVNGEVVASRKPHNAPRIAQTANRTPQTAQHPPRPANLNKSMILKKIFKGTGFLTLAFIGIATQHTNDYEVAKNLEIFGKVYKEVHSSYLEELDPEKVIGSGMEAMLQRLDPYSDYIPPQEVENFESSLSGKYGGIGTSVIIDKDKKIAYITEVYENSPAAKAGIQAGDIFVNINNRAAETQNLAGISAQLRGLPQTDLQVEVKRGDKLLKFSLKRAEIHIENVPFYTVLEQDIAYVVLSTFTQQAAKNVTQALNLLKSKNNIKGIVLDLRGNTGGLLQEAVQVANIFIPKGKLVVKTKGRERESDQSYYTIHPAVDPTTPLVILIDSKSASASEIVAGAIQDTDRGVVIGERSFGKGLVQSTYDISYGAKLKLTTARYYTPSGRCIQSTSYKEGKPVPIADSLRAKFKTQKGRTVYDGGGISPDLDLANKEFSSLLESLVKQELIFDFAVRYHLQNPKINALPANMSLTDKDYTDFLSLLTNRKFKHTTQTEQLLNELEKQAKAEHYEAEIAPELASIRKNLETEQANLLQKYKTQLLHELLVETAKHYFYEKGALQAAIRTNACLQKAISLLQKETSLYNKLLNP